MKITSSKEILILVNGHSKARALAACGELTVNTYKYFLDIEKKERL
jgi:glucosamine-6-phosphate deaminase